MATPQSCKCSHYQFMRPTREIEQDFLKAMRRPAAANRCCRIFICDSAGLPSSENSGTHSADTVLQHPSQTYELLKLLILFVSRPSGYFSLFSIFCKWLPDDLIAKMMKSRPPEKVMGLTGMWPGYRGDAEQGVLRRRSPYHNPRLSLALSALYGPPGGRRKVQRGSYLANFASLSLSL